MTKNAGPRDKALDRAARSKREDRRPLCPACGARMPGPGERRDDWLSPWGHRRPHDNECCPGFRSTPTIAPPPPMHRPAPQPTAVELWHAWFAQRETKKPPKLKRARRVPMAPKPEKRARKRTAPPAGQQVLFSLDGKLWCDPPANTQKRYPLVLREPSKQRQTG